MSIFRKRMLVSLRLRWNDIWPLGDVVLLGTCYGRNRYLLPLLVPRHRLWLALLWLFQSWFQPCVGMSAIFLLSIPRYPSAGGAPWLPYAVWGEYPAWMGGWLTMIVFMNAVSSVASGWGAYLKGLLAGFGLKLPHAISGPFNPSQGTYIDLLPVLVLVLVTALLLMNSKHTLRWTLWYSNFSALAVFCSVALSIWIL